MPFQKLQPSMDDMSVVFGVSNKLSVELSFLVISSGETAAPKPELKFSVFVFNIMLFEISISVLTWSLSDRKEESS